MSQKVIMVSRCARTLFNFRAGLMKAVKAHGYEVLGGGSGGDGYEPSIEALGVPFSSLPVSFKPINPFADLALVWTLYRWYRREKPVVVHHFTVKPVIYGSIAARMARVPRIINTITGLGYAFTGERVTWLRRIVERLYAWSLAGSDFTFFQNRDDWEQFTQRGLVASERTALLPGSGVDIDHFSPRVGRDNSADSEATIFLIVARLLRDKGIYEYVEAARQVKTRYPSARFQVLGARDARNPGVVPQADVEKWQSDGLVELLGEVSDVRGAVADADVVVLPSYREGIPRALLEAAAMARPIITTDAVGCREAVDHEQTGLLVPIRDVPALAEAMIRMIEDPALRERMGAAGRRKMEREFDERIVIEKVMEAYGAGSGT